MILLIVIIVVVGVMVMLAYNNRQLQLQTQVQQTGVSVVIPSDDASYTDPNPDDNYRQDYDTPVYHTTDQEMNVVNSQAIPLTKTVEFVKDSTGSGLLVEDEKTFQVAELKAYSNRLLTTKDYSSARYGADNTSNYFTPYNAIDGDTVSFSHTKGNQDIHILLLDFVNPQQLTKLEVYCREGYGARLAGTRVNLRDSAGKILDTFVLGPQEIQTLNPMY